MQSTGAKLWVAVFVAIITVGSSVAVGATVLSAAPTTGASLSSAVVSTAAPTAAASTGSTISGDPADGYALSVSPSREAAVDTARSAFASAGLLNDFFPPNLNAAPTNVVAQTGHIVPLYNYAPAPMGVSTFGLENTSGTITPYILNTTSLEGTFSTGDTWGLQAQSLYYGTQEAYGAQLNTVLVGTTVSQNSSNDYWLQNVIQYTTSTDTLSFVLNIWNFSNPSFDFPSSSILHGNGRVEESEVYETSGPSITIAYPYTLDLYLNTTVGSYDGSPKVNEVYFNYSVYNALGQHVCPTSEPTGDVCGEYDNVYFNSKQAVAPGSAEIQANGYQYNPSGLPTDMELDYGIGQSDGANVNVAYSNVTVGLLVLNATTGTYVPPPSAYDFGSETGETGIGSVGTWGTEGGVPVVHLTTGPSLLTGLWNTSTPEGSYALNYTNVAPSNAFIAIAPGTNVTNQSYFQVAPTFGWFTPGGAIGANIYLSPGDYTVEVLLSGYNITTTNVDLTGGGDTLALTLGRETVPTVYTPLWAYNSTQLAAISTGGDGTAGSPYTIVSDQPGSIAPVFAVLNDYLFEVYSGIYLNDTTAYVNFAPAPSLTVDYPSWWIPQLESLGEAYGAVPLSNALPIYLYHAQNVTIAYTAGIGLWSFTEAQRYYSTYINVGKNDLLYDNTFTVWTEGVEFLGGTTGVVANNYVYGNTFVPISNASYPGIYTPTTGLTVSSNGNHIYNNAFYTNGTAASSTTYTNFWNASGGYQASTNYITVNGFVLGNSSNIIGQNLLGGNYWFNYGAVANPYGVPYVARASSPTGTAAIGHNADYAPLTIYTPVANAPVIPAALGTGLYHVTFTEIGLTVGNSWTLRIHDVPVDVPETVSTYTTNPANTTTVALGGTSNAFYVPNGTYTWTLAVKPTGSVASISTGTLTVNGTSVSVSISFSWTVTFKETGLPSLTSWAATLNGKLGEGTGSELNFTIAAGSYAYTASAIPAGWVASPSSGTTTVSAAETITIAFSSASLRTYTVYFTQSGLAAGTQWSVTINGDTVSTTTPTLSFSLVAGTYTYAITAVAGYSANPSTGSVTVSSSAVSTGITFTPVTYALTFTETGLPASTTWAVQVNGVILGGVTGATASSITFSLTAGTYTWVLGYINGWTPSPSSGSVTITNSGQTVDIAWVA